MNNNNKLTKAIHGRLVTNKEIEDMLTKLASQDVQVNQILLTYKPSTGEGAVRDWPTRHPMVTKNDLLNHLNLIQINDHFYRRRKK